MDPKNPFDDAEFSGKKEGAAGQASSATGVFGTVGPKGPAQEEDDLLKSLMRGADAAPNPASAETQASPPVVPAPVAAAPPAPGEFTQILKTLSEIAQVPQTAQAPKTAPKQSGDLASVFK